ncbi:MAG: triose-phosphate isomerase [Acidobacteriota bacterium]|nr:triose-phosphate isomerase [Acidobacteriota bacterium]
MPDQQSTRRTVVIGNWKMHKTGAEGVALAAGIVAGLRPGRAQVAVAPPFPALAPVADAIRESSVALAAQDVFHEREGAFTGAVSAPMLAAAGCSIVLVGHSERRHVFGDDDEAVRRKALAVLDAGLRPVVCVGETAGQRDAGRAEDVVREQLEAVVRGLSDTQLPSLTVAYEPVWAIGTGRTATPDTAEAMHRVIRSNLASLAGSGAAERTPILYGGSVKGDNAGAILSGANVDGLLVGGASLRADSFLDICHAAG